MRRSVPGSALRAARG